MKHYTKHIISFVLALVMLMGIIPLPVEAKELSSGAVERRLQEILNEYPAGSYFTESGKAAHGDADHDCALSAIPAKGDLCDGDTVSKQMGESNSCVAFARYVSYNIFHASLLKGDYTRIENPTELLLGDIVVYSNGHWAIFLSRDADTGEIYVYDANYTAASDSKIQYYHTCGTFSYGLHANNYTPAYYKNVSITTTSETSFDISFDTVGAVSAHVCIAGNGVRKKTISVALNGGNDHFEQTINVSAEQGSNPDVSIVLEDSDHYFVTRFYKTVNLSHAKRVLDSTYEKNFSATANCKIAAPSLWDENGDQVTNHYLDKNDTVTIAEVYQSGECKVHYSKWSNPYYYYTYIDYFDFNFGGGGDGGSTPVSDTCGCSSAYAGTYEVTTSSKSLNLRSTHSTSGTVLTSIPKGTQVYVSVANGAWAHVNYNGQSGYASMDYLAKVTDNGNTPTEEENDDVHFVEAPNTTGFVLYAWFNGASQIACHCYNESDNELPEHTITIPNGSNYWMNLSEANCIRRYTIILETDTGIRHVVNGSKCAVEIPAKYTRYSDDIIYDNAVFNASFYRSLYDDLANMSDEQLRAHWKCNGIEEGRTASPVFNINWYKCNTDVVNAYGGDHYSLIKHFVNYVVNGTEIRETCETFNIGYYKAQNGDLSKFTNRQAFDHYVTYYSTEHRKTCANWSVTQYRANYAGLDNAYGNDWSQYVVHYYKYGKSEGRLGTPLYCWLNYGAATLSNEKLYIVHRKPYTGLPTPELEGYNFLGWYDKDGNLITAETEVSAKVVHALYARWERKTYTVTYDANGGTGAPEAQIKTHGNDLVLSSTEPTRENYEFWGWCEDSKCLGVSYSSGDTYTIDSNIVLYAVWDEILYTDPCLTVGSAVVDAGDEFTVDIALAGRKSVYAGQFILEYDNAKLEVLSCTRSNLATGNCDINTNYSSNQIFIGFDSSFVGVLRSRGVIASVKFKAISSGASELSFKSYKMFTELGSSLPVTAINSKITVLGDAKSYTVKYDSNGGTGTMSDSSFTYGTASTLSANAFTKTGYTFQGWSESSSATSATYTDNQSTSNLTSEDGGIVNLYAVWKANTYTVTYDGNGNTGGSTAISTHTYDVAQNLTANGFTRAYTVSYNYGCDIDMPESVTAASAFNGWAEKENGRAVYADQQSVLNLAATDGAAVRLYATWKLAEIILPSPAREGYTFQGWYKDPEFKAETGAGGDSLSPTEDMVLYAKWKADNIDKGSCGDNIEWILSNDGILTIIGTGNMSDWIFGGRPWESYLNQIKEVMIEDSVTSIGVRAFSGCENLAGITISDSVTDIKAEAFAGCSSLTNITISKYVTSIGRTGIFVLNKNQPVVGTQVIKAELSAELDFGEDAECINGGSVFSSCSSLMSITVAEGNIAYSSENGTLFNKDKSELISYPGGKQGSYSIPNSVKTIGIYAFYGCTGLTEVVVPDSVTNIGHDVFSGCNNLTVMSVPTGIIDSEGNAFVGCGSLINMYYDEIEGSGRKVTINSAAEGYIIISYYDSVTGRMLNTAFTKMDVGDNIIEIDAKYSGCFTKVIITSQMFVPLIPAVTIK